MALTKEDLRSIGDLMDRKMDQKFAVFEKKINKNTDQKIEDLARLAAGGFKDVEERLSKKIDVVDEKLANRIDAVDEKLTNRIGSLHLEMHSEFRKVNEKIDDIEVKIDRIDDRTLKDENAMAGDIVDLRKRVKKLERVQAV